MTRSVFRASWVNWAGSAALVAVMAAVGTAQAGQDTQGRSGVVQKGREGRTEQATPADARAGYDLAKGKTGRTETSVSSGQISAITGGAVAGIVVARAEDQVACDSGTASACRAIESGLTTGGAWAFVDGGITAMDDWETPVTAVSSFGSLAGSGGGAAAASYARSSATASAPTASASSSGGGVRGTHFADAVLVHRVLAACDSGDASACRAFAQSIRPATATERAETRTYTAGR
ncbi:MAG: hypothetical protein JHC81_11110 [Brevundimonas sp.]|uniref:hypothetical protein n=1 Tax=Brevundimonas sp. TaxID=1871086 RepID=UPI001A350B1B|nr:hypothetical protein [Brevundimonas sp.]MBJ7448073.1 hypothetical protein [Brevundimonas sp.]